MKVAAGIVQYRFWPGISDTIQAIQAQTRPPDELFVYDHASQDGSVERIREAHPGVEVIEAPVNGGPGAGSHALLEALAARDADAVLFLTHNARLSPDALEHLVARLEAEPGLGAAGPLIGYADEPDRVFFAGGTIDPRTWDIGFRHVPESMAAWDGAPPHEADWMELAGLLMRTDAVRQTGELFVGYFYQYDDNDFTVRMRSKGWRLEVVPAARAWKQPGERSTYLEVRNRLGFVNRTAPRRVLARELVRAAWFTLRHTWRPAPDKTRQYEFRSRSRAIIDFLRGRWGEPPESIRRLGAGRYG